MTFVKSISVLDTSIVTQNIGDEIIMDAVYSQLHEVFKDKLFVKIPTHEIIGLSGLSLIRNSQFGIVGGSNILSSAMNKYRQWKITLFQSLFIKQKIILLGVGWRDYQTRPNIVTRLLLKNLLNRNMLHSVRDSYTESKLRNIGFSNIINTSCPTMWNFTPQYCDKIPKTKSDTVVFTLTDYSKNIELDLFLINFLLEHYTNVYFWVQGRGDLNYLNELNVEIDRIKIVPPTLHAYTEFLEFTHCDYIGTRLHGGIRALQKNRRTIIVGIDNRAIEKKKDFNLNVIERKDLKIGLMKLVTEDLPTQIRIPLENINLWKNQFIQNDGNKSVS
ncbi:polysaccharide pyruvyl transferase family protein [Parapusillimonas sp. SGNA-6]|uniref:polysaccharide pyruvyl transferase family protein n=1 Tax=Parapedobacter sp. SGR-10 TaxID=2710879 RepID=UPI0013D86BD6|nr:polysaccharide pyruvyl transferase family protein [Parapedobacter sp. SGR-10]NGF56546.1 polysaccharide pyruvyl transferase family protein [Parapedobacter sp. SGR-10]NGM89238.1 polysaccharide pyruvyl transferase family protein [Parapusillimonas sp. SGNA-6]